MNKGFYLKMAWGNIRKNRNIYLPYLLAASVMTALFYIQGSLCDMVDISGMKGKRMMSSLLGISTPITGIFSLVILFYVNSFVMKQRKKEFGLYNVLGMEKRHLVRLMSVEILLVAVFSLVFGISGGALFSQLFFLIFYKMIRMEADLTMVIPRGAVIETLTLFGILFCLVLLYDIVAVIRTRPVELLKSESQGEREPKVHGLAALIGVAALTGGYVIAQKVESPMEAMLWFFAAALLVIIGTYGLFMAGSIALLKWMKKRERFYYRPSSFISVSGMLYRMKQNAVGLSNICVLSTMVLVTISSTVSLYIGKEDVLRTRYPQEVYITNSVSDDAENQKLHDMVEKICRDNQVEITDEKSWHMAELVKIKNGEEYTSAMIKDNSSSDVVFFDVIRLADYNKLTGERLELGDKEAILFTNGENYGKDTIRIDEETWMVKKELDTAPFGKKSDSNTENVYYMIVSDEKEFMKDYLEKYQLEAEDKPVKWRESFNLRGSEDQKLKAVKELKAQAESEFEHTGVQGRYLEKETFFGLYGGVFFIGMYLGSLFLMATVLIIYYKQISEGFDDRERYQIMQKVGMSKREVKSSIRSQILTVFFLPLVMAIIHIAVAFPVITKLLAIFYLKNTKLFFGCTACTVGIFAVFYVIIFVITAKEYYKIVE